MRAVFDSNVYLAAASNKSSYSRQQIERANPNGIYQLYISPEIILEIRDRLEVKFGYTPRESAQYIDTVLRYAIQIQPKTHIRGVLADPDDHIILECAVEAKADFIASADRGLLKLKQYQGIAIVHPTMLQHLR